MRNCPSWTELARQGVEEGVKEGVPYCCSGSGREGGQRRQPVHFIVTITRERGTNENTPYAYYYIASTMTATWHPSEFIPIQEWLQGEERALEVAAEAEQAEKGHAADQPQVQEQQPEKGHAADHPSGEKATQGSGISTQI